MNRTWLLLALLAVLAGVLTALLTPTPTFGAPVPKGAVPPKKPVDPVQPGYQWNYAGHLLEVTAVDGECVAYRCLNRPSQTWPGLDGYWEVCRQSKARTLAEAEQYRNAALLPWEFDF